MAEERERERKRREKTMKRDARRSEREEKRKRRVEVRHHGNASQSNLAGSDPRMWERVESEGRGNWGDKGIGILDCLAQSC